MCGRFTLKTAPDQWGQLLLPLIDLATAKQAWQPRYNIAPTQAVLAVACGVQPEGVPVSMGLLPESTRPKTPDSETDSETDSEPDSEPDSEIDSETDALPESGSVSSSEPSTTWAHYFRWGLVPAWGADLAVGNSMINARSESLHEKRSFKGPLAKRRCLILADGYYEWQVGKEGKKHPYWITPATGSVIHLAGLWDVNVKAKARPITSCTIITTAASGDLKHLHDRMPVVLDSAAAASWLDIECAADAAQALLGPAPEGYFTPQEVSTYVNNPRHEDARCLEPAPGSGLVFGVQCE